MNDIFLYQCNHHMLKFVSRQFTWTSSKSELKLIRKAMTWNPNKVFNKLLNGTMALKKSMNNKQFKETPILPYQGIC